jgi:hypothetical protein
LTIKYIYQLKENEFNEVDNSPLSLNQESGGLPTFNFRGIESKNHHDLRLKIRSIFQVRTT